MVNSVIVFKLIIRPLRNGETNINSLTDQKPNARTLAWLRGEIFANLSKLLVWVLNQSSCTVFWILKCGFIHLCLTQNFYFWEDRNCEHKRGGRTIIHDVYQISFCLIALLSPRVSYFYLNWCQFIFLHNTFHNQTHPMCILSLNSKAWTWWLQNTIN